MKKSLLLFVFGLITISSFCQTPAETKLKQENQALKSQLIKAKTEIDTLQKEKSALIQDTTFLRNQVELCSLYGKADKVEQKNTNSNFKIKLISCTGNRASQQVEAIFMVEHRLPNQRFFFNRYSTEKAKAYDALGNLFVSNKFQVGSQTVYSIEIPTNIPVRIVVVFNNMMPGNDLLKLLSTEYQSYNLDDSNKQEGTLEFKDLKVDWN